MTDAPSTLGFRDVDWVAEQLGLEKNTVYRYLNEGKLPGLQLGKKWLIEEQTLREWLLREQRLQTERRQANDWAETDLGAHVSPDGTVTILFSDIAGSSAMVQRLGDKGWQDLYHTHNGIVSASLAETGRSEVKSLGDGFMVGFESARQAVRSAIEMQRAFALYSAEHPELPLNVAQGLHAGEVIREGNDFVGRNVFIAALVAQQARPGQIVVSAALKELVEEAGEFQFDEGKMVEMRGLLAKQRVYQVVWQPVPAAPGAFAAILVDG